MRSLTVTSAFGQLVAVGAPLGALLITLFLVYPAWGRYSAGRTELARAQADLQHMRAAPAVVNASTVPAVPDTPAEPSQFLGAMSGLARESRCEIAGLEVQPADGKPEKGVRPIRARLTLRGRFIDVRSFVMRLREAPRVYTVTEIMVKSLADDKKAQVPQAAPVTPGGVEATIGIERYVAASAPEAGKATGS